MSVIMLTIAFMILNFVINILKVSFFKKDILEIIVGIIVFIFGLRLIMTVLIATETLTFLDLFMFFMLLTWTKPFMNEFMDNVIIGRKEIRVYNQAKTMMMFLKHDLKKWERDLKVLEKSANETKNESAKALILEHYKEMKEHYDNLKENYDKIMAENNKEDIIKKIR